MLRCRQSSFCRFIGKNNGSVHLRCDASNESNSTVRSALMRPTLQDSMEPVVSFPSRLVKDFRHSDCLATLAKPPSNNFESPGNISRTLGEAVDPSIVGRRRRRKTSTESRSEGGEGHLAAFNGSEPGFHLVQQISELTTRTRVCDKATVASLISQYYSTRTSTTAFKRLSSRELDQLVMICGTYSILEGTPESNFHGHLVVNSSGTTDKERERHWDFIHQVQEDKETILGLKPTIVDRYWKLQAGIFRAWEERNVSRERLEDSLKKVTSTYRELRTLSQDHGMHMSFFQTALTLPTGAHIARIIPLLCDYLQRDSIVINADYADIFWKLTVELGERPSPRLQKQMLTFVSTRIPRFALCQAPVPRPVHSKADQLPSILASVVFDMGAFKGPSLETWLRQIGHAAFQDDLPPEIRWENLLFLATNLVPSDRSLKAAQLNGCTKSQTWRTILFLSFLKTTLNSVRLVGNAIGPLEPDLRNVLHQLWRTWETSSRSPAEINRLVLAIFFELAGWTMDEDLIHHCLRFARQHEYFYPREGSSELGRAQFLSMIATYVASLARCRNYDWEMVLPNTKSIVPKEVPLGAVISRVLDQLASHGTEQANAFHSFALSRRLIPSTATSLKLAVSLAQEEEWSAAIPFLSNSQFSPLQRERLLVAFLRVFQLQRSETVHPSLANPILDTMMRLYESSAPSPYAKYPIRYFLKPLIAAGYCTEAVDLVTIIFRHDHNFFTQRCVRRYLVQLVAKHGARDAVRLLRLFQHAFTAPGVADLHRKLALALNATGAYARAATIFKRQEPHRLEHPRRVTRTPRERMLVASLSRSPSRGRLSTLAVMDVLKKVNFSSKTYVPAARFAISFLVKHGRMFAARKIYGWSSKAFDFRTHTAIGNIILHGCFQGALIDARLLRHLLHTKKMLSDNYQFKCDAATTNILAKAVLRARSRCNSKQLRVLFDEFVRRDYPGLRTQHGVPFGTHPTSLDQQPDIMADLPRPTSFNQHIRPLYKMFIKAFQLRNDTVAAKTVVAILQEQRHEDMERKEKRNQARREGIARKKAREADQVIGTRHGSLYNCH